MEIVLIVCLFGLFVAAWIHFRNRVEVLESHVEALMRANAARSKAAVSPEPVMQPAQQSPVVVRQPEPPVPARVVDQPVVQQPAVHEPVMPPAPPPPVVVRPPEPPSPAAPVRPALTPDWEATLGGNWLSKAGVLLFVISIALGLGYSFSHMGPAGRVAISLAVSFAMLVTGAVFEPREPYRILARGLLGGGWAALYFTVYAMHALPPARVIDNPVLAAILLFAVATGMIGHSLRYRSQTVSGLAYFIAFATLAITQVTLFSMLALVPLAASLLFLSRRFAWSGMALLGLIATYSVLVLRGDTGAPLWQAQAIFSICWLLFEAFDILGGNNWLLPLNAVGFLGLSLTKWHAAAPDQVWVLLGASAIAYLASAVLRARSGKWQAAATLTAALTAAAIFQRLDHQWIASALVVEAELCYLAGVRLRSPYLRWLATSLFAIEAGRLLLVDASSLPVRAWVPVAALDAAIFYANRALYAGDVFYGYAAAAMAAVIAGYETSEPVRGQTWFVMAAAPFLIGWWRRLRDFRFQGYGLASLGVLGLLFAFPQPRLGLATGAVLSYALALCAVFSDASRWGGKDSPLERDVVRFYGAVGASIGAAALVWRLAPGENLGLEWMALAVVLLELGLRGLPGELFGPAYAIAAMGAVRIAYFNLPALQSNGPLMPRIIPGAASILAYAIAVRARNAGRGRVFAIASAAGTAFLLTALWALAPNAATPAWAAVMLALFYLGSRRDIAGLRSQSYVVAALTFGRCLIVNIIGAHDAILTGVIVITLLYAAQFLSARKGSARLYYSLLATCLTTLLLYFKVSASLLTVAWGIEGVALLASGFPLRDRLLRISGLAILLACILKLFAWDLRHLETLPRILSFMVLGLLLVGVSWIYSRFRERLASVLRL